MMHASGLVGCGACFASKGRIDFVFPPASNCSYEHSHLSSHPIARRISISHLSGPSTSRLWSDRHASHAAEPFLGASRIPANDISPVHATISVNFRKPCSTTHAPEKAVKSRSCIQTDDFRSDKHPLPIVNPRLRSRNTIDSASWLSTSTGLRSWRTPRAHERC
jgi:hypothetical protein